MVFFHLFFKFSAKLLHGFFLASRWKSKSRKICLCIYRQLLFSHKFASCILCQFWQKTWLFCIKENNHVKGLFLTKIRYIHIQWRQTDQSISAMALVVFLPRPESIVYRIFMLVHFIPQNSLPCPVGTGDHEASLAPLCIGLVTGKKRKKLQFIHMFLIYVSSTLKAQKKVHI